MHRRVDHRKVPQTHWSPKYFFFLILTSLCPYVKLNPYEEECLQNTKDFWSKLSGSIEALLPLLESTKGCTVSMCGEHFGVGIGVAAVRRMMGGGMLPLPSRCPLGVTAREYIFNSGKGTVDEPKQNRAHFWRRF